MSIEITVSLPEETRLESLRAWADSINCRLTLTREGVYRFEPRMSDEQRQNQLKLVADAARGHGGAA